jgi:hypothetical protein
MTVRENMELDWKDSFCRESVLSAGLVLNLSGGSCDLWLAGSP